MPLPAKMVRRGWVPQGQRTAAVHLPAPVGGINTVSAASAMPPTDCLHLVNLIPFQYGLRVRSGYYTWASGMQPHPGSPSGLYDDGSPIMFHFTGPIGGAEPNAWRMEDPIGVRSVLAFSGAKDTGSKLWGVSDEGIWDCTNSTSSPRKVVEFSYFGLEDGPKNAGRGISTNFITKSGGHYFLYADGAHGYYYYSEADAKWFKARSCKYADRPDAVNETGAGWLADTALAGDSVSVACRGPFTGMGKQASNAKAGDAAAATSSAAESEAEDGLYIYAASQLLEDVYGVFDASKIRFVMKWKSRIFFCLEGSSTAWYLDTDAMAGPAYPMPFAPRFMHGGELVGLWSWTVDGGVGIDDHLVAISRGGDVVIFSGTDPAIPGAFGIRGVWWVGTPPPGRRIASQFGGDLFILSIVGCVPLSKLVSGGLIRDPDVMASGKVANLFNKLMTERGHIEGWSIVIHPTDNIMLVIVPPVPGKPGLQLSMSLANQGWSEHTGVPMACAEVWNNKLYFGTMDGKICVNEGWVDDVPLGASTVRPIDWYLLTSYQSIGGPNKKRVHMIRPHFMTDGTPPAVAVGARFDFDRSAVDILPSQPCAMGAAWDTAVWNGSYVLSGPVTYTGCGWSYSADWVFGGAATASDSEWDDGVGTCNKTRGAAGIGSHIALVMRGRSVTETTFVGFDVMLEQGGLL